MSRCVPHAGQWICELAFIHPAGGVNPLSAAPLHGSCPWKPCISLLHSGGLLMRRFFNGIMSVPFSCASRCFAVCFPLACNIIVAIWCPLASSHSGLALIAAQHCLTARRSILLVAALDALKYWESNADRQFLAAYKVSSLKVCMPFLRNLSGSAFLLPCCILLLCSSLYPHSSKPANNSNQVAPPSFAGASSHFMLARKFLMLPRAACCF